MCLFYITLYVCFYISQLQSIFLKSYFFSISETLESMNMNQTLHFYSYLYSEGFTEGFVHTSFA